MANVHKGHFCMNIKTYFTFTKIKDFLCSCKVCIEVEHIDRNQHPHVNSQSPTTTRI